MEVVMDRYDVSIAGTECDGSKFSRDNRYRPEEPSFPYERRPHPRTISTVRRRSSAFLSGLTPFGASAGSI